MRVEGRLLFRSSTQSGAREVAPDLKNGKYDQQSKDSPQGTQQTGGRALENAGPRACSEQHDNRENRARG